MVFVKLVIIAGSEHSLQLLKMETQQDTSVQLVVIAQKEPRCQTIASLELSILHQVRRPNHLVNNALLENTVEVPILIDLQEIAELVTSAQVDRVLPLKISLNQATTQDQLHQNKSHVNLAIINLIQVNLNVENVSLVSTVLLLQCLKHCLVQREDIVKEEQQGSYCVKQVLTMIMS